MAHWTSRILALWFAFTIEVQIHATSSAWLIEPLRCHPGESGCVFSAREDKASVEWSGHEAAVAKGTVLTWHDSFAVEVIHGSALFQFHEPGSVRLPSATLTGQADILLKREGIQTELTCVRGELSIRLLGAKEDVTLPAGYRVVIGPVTRTGVAEMEIPLSAPLAPTIRQWWNLYPGTKQTFLPLAKQFMASVIGNVNKASQWHLELVQRQVASQREADRMEAERRRRAEAENLKLRSLFRKMNFLGEELPD